MNLLDDLWLHIAALISVTLGLLDLWHFHALSQDADLLFIIGGFAGLGLKIVNGSAQVIRDRLNGK